MIGLWLTPDEIWSYLIMQHESHQKRDETRSLTCIRTYSDPIWSCNVLTGVPPYAWWLTYVSLVFVMYQFIYNPRVKSIKMLIFFENPLIPSSIHIYPPGWWRWWWWWIYMMVPWLLECLYWRWWRRRRIHMMVLWIRLIGSVFASEMSKHD